MEGRAFIRGTNKEEKMDGSVYWGREEGKDQHVGGTIKEKVRGEGRLVLPIIEGVRNRDKYSAEKNS